MARLPTPMMVDNLRFTDNTTLAFTVKWASDDPYAGMIDHIRVRFMMTNLLALGVGGAEIPPEDVKIVMEEWTTELTILTAGTEPVPTGWNPDLGVLHRIDDQSTTPFDGTDDNATAGDNIHEEELTTSHAAFQQRFVRLIAQARTRE